ERVSFVVEYMKGLEQLREKLVIGRRDDLHIPVGDGTGRLSDLEFDGTGGDAFWQDVPEYSMRRLSGGEEPEQKTTVRAKWAEGSLYLLVVAQESQMETLKIGSLRDGDLSILSGDAIEVVIET